RATDGRGNVFMPGTIRFTSIVPVFAALLLAIALAAAADAQTKSRFDLSPQPLGKALNAFAIQAGLNIYFDSPAVAVRESPALKAELTADDALARLLAGTGLKAVYVNANTVRVMADPGLKDVHTSQMHENPGSPAGERLSLAQASAPGALETN